MTDKLTLSRVLDQLPSGRKFRRSGWHDGKHFIYFVGDNTFGEPFIEYKMHGQAVYGPYPGNRADWFATDWQDVTDQYAKADETVTDAPPSEAEATPAPDDPPA